MLFSNESSDILDFMDFMAINFKLLQFEGHKIKMGKLANWGRGTNATKTDIFLNLLNSLSF
jgi:hypothetical protein